MDPPSPPNTTKTTPPPSTQFPKDDDTTLTGGGDNLTKKGPEYEASIRTGDTNIAVDLSSVPVQVANVHFDGLGRTKRDYVQDSIYDVFNAKNFEELILKVGVAQKKLRSLAVFKEVGTLVDISKVVGATKDDYEVTFLVKELNKINGGISGMVGSNEGSAQVGISLPNLFGRGEILAFNRIMTSKSANRLEVNYTVPSPYTSSQMTYSLYQCQSPNPFSSVTTSSLGSEVRLDVKPRRNDTCSLQWHAVWRQLTALNPLASFSIREFFGHSFKAAARLVYSTDKRDQPIFPTDGTLRKITLELAGLVGDAKFLKVESDFQYNRSLWNEVVFQGSLRGGLFQPLSTSGLSYEINDLFFLGGPCSLRGFAMRGVGPRSQQNALGGKVIWASAFHLYSPLPLLNKKFPMMENLRMHGFMNVGSIGQNASECLDSKNLRGSTGLGIAYRFGNMARLELNYCFPFKFGVKDQCVKGFQFGLGLDFL